MKKLIKNITPMAMVAITCMGMGMNNIEAFASTLETGIVFANPEKSLYFPVSATNGLSRNNELFAKYPILVDAYEHYRGDIKNIQFGYKQNANGDLIELMGRPVVNGKYADGLGDEFIPLYKTTEEERKDYPVINRNLDGITEEYIAERFEKLKIDYPQGMSWTEANKYSSQYVQVHNEEYYDLSYDGYGGGACNAFGGVAIDYLYGNFKNNDETVYLYSYYNDKVERYNSIDMIEYEFKIVDHITAFGVNSEGNASSTGHVSIIMGYNEETGKYKIAGGNEGSVVNYLGELSLEYLRANTYHVLSAFEYTKEDGSNIYTYPNIHKV